MRSKDIAQHPIFQSFVGPLTHGMFRLLVDAVMRLSPEQAYGLGRFVAFFCWLFGGRRRRRAIRNLEIAFGDRFEPWQRSALSRATVTHFVLTLLDVVLLQRFTTRDEILQVVEVTAAHRRAFADLAADGPVAFHTGHFGSWEALSVFAGMYGMPIDFVYRPIDHPLIDADVRTWRTRFGSKAYPKRGALKGYIRTLREGGNLGVIADQNGGRGNAYLNFFGVSAATEVGYFGLYQRFTPRTVCAFMVRKGYQFAFTFVGPVEETVRPDADPLDEAMRLGQWYLGEVERVAAQWPAQYLWTHRRYGSRPPGAPGLYDDLGQPLSPECLRAQPEAPIPPQRATIERRREEG